MIGTRHEEYGQLIDGLPFVLHTDLKRSRFARSKENNWHENLELQICTEGCGSLLINGKRLPFRKNDVAVINSNAIHYTGSDSELTYSCLIVSTDFCRRVGISPGSVIFESHIKSAALTGLFEELIRTYSDTACELRVAKLNKLVLEILIELAERHTLSGSEVSYDERKFETVRATLSYIREHYAEKLTLDEICRAVFYDRYALCRLFKRLTGQTIFENLNGYRCIKASELLAGGQSVSQAASACGFENLSFFTRTFKKHMGALPSEYKR